MKKTHFCQKALVVALGSLYISIAQAQSYLPHVTLEGMTGSQTYGRLDALAPLVPGCNSLFFADVQAKYGYDDAYYVGLGLGDRVISGDRILGGYLFLDYNESQHHHDYWVLSPGLELIKACWDVRLNGYIPVNGRRTNEGSFFPSGPNECGIHGDCSFVEFSGHQQFEHRFMRIEEVGPGADLVFGKKWGCNNLFQIGPYYYHMSDSSDVIGGVARVELPLRAGVSLVGEASYDNDHHGAAVMGLQYRFNNPRSCAPLCDRLYDQVYRYRGNLNTGTGIRVKHDTKDEGLFLRRDNIFFFSPTGTAVITDPNAGTFENPFGPEVIQTDIDAIGRFTNLYFSTGSYVLDPATGLINLSTGQSIYGRTADFKCTANGDERPILLGELNIDFSENNVLDSIQLRNIQTNPLNSVIALDLFSTINIRICNSDILAEADFIGDNPLLNTNEAIGIGHTGDLTANSVTIDHSRITAIASVTGNNSGINAASAIGRELTSGALFGNQFVIRDSELNAFAIVGLNNIAPGALDTAANMAAGIGTNTVDFGGVASQSFEGNEFTLIDVQINATAQVGNDNIGIGNVANMATGIGVNYISASAGASNTQNRFLGNTLSLTCTEILTNALVGRDNTAVGQAYNMAAGIGNNIVEANNLPGIIIFVDLADNHILLDNSEIQSLALVGRDNIDSGTGVTSIAFNAATGIGINNVTASDVETQATISNNTIAICNSNIDVKAQVTRDNINSSISTLGRAYNMAAGLGNNLVAESLGAPVLRGGVFNNHFTIDSSQIQSTALIGNNNFTNSDVGSAVNMAVGVGNNAIYSLGTSALFTDFNFNELLMNDSEILGSAIINGSNIALTESNVASNLAAGLGVNITFPGFAPSVTDDQTGNRFTISNSRIIGLAQIGNDNIASSEELAAAFNGAVGIGTNVMSILDSPSSAEFINFANSIFNFSGDQIGAIARIGNDNFVPSGTLTGVFNLATGIGVNTGIVALEPSFITVLFNENLYTFCDTAIFANALIGNDNIALGADVFAFNQALDLGINSGSIGTSSFTSSFDGNIININCNSLTAHAFVGGDQNINAINSATGIITLKENVVADISNTISIFNTFMDILAQVNGDNLGTNLALGLSARGVNDLIQIFDSVVNVTALANGINNAIATEGNVVATNTQFNVVQN